MGTVKVVRRLLLVLVVVALGVTVDYVAHAETVAVAAASPADDGKSNCVSVWMSEALDDTGKSSTFTWGTGEALWLNFWCYYDLDVSGPTATAGADTWFTGATAPTSSDTIIFAGASSENHTATGTGTTGFVWSDYTLFTSDPALGYVHAMVKIKRWSGIAKTQTVPLNKMTFCVRATGTGSDCTTSGAKVLGSSGTGTATTNTWSLAYSGWLAGTGITGPSYYWGASAYSSIPAWCGASSTVTSHAMDDVVEPGDVLTFSTDWTSAVTDLVEVRFSGSNTSWWSVFQYGAIANPYIGTVTVPNASPYAWRVGDLDMRCRDSRYPSLFPEKDVEDATTGTLDARPCNLARFYGPELAAIDLGDTAAFTINYSGVLDPGYTPTTLDVEYFTWDEDGEFPSSASATWVTLFDDVGLGTVDVANATAGFNGSTAQFVFRCTDADGSMMGGQWLGNRRGVTQLPGDLNTRDSDCVSSAGWGLHPASWAPALARTGSCILRALFVPSSTAVEELRASAGASAEKAPISFIAESGVLVYSSVSGADAAVIANRDGCFVVLPPMTEIEVVEQTVCPADLSSGALTTARTIIGIAFWVGFAWMLWTLTRKLISE